MSRTALSWRSVFTKFAKFCLGIINPAKLLILFNQKRFINYLSIFVYVAVRINCFCEQNLESDGNFIFFSKSDFKSPLSTFLQFVPHNYSTDF